MSLESNETWRGDIFRAVHTTSLFLVVCIDPAKEGTAVQYQISAEAINAICNVFASSEGSAARFATLASNFVNTLAVGSPMDLGKDWLLHRLHCILVEHQSLTPGEIEVMRADIRARAETSNLSMSEAELLASGIERSLVISHG